MCVGSGRPFIYMCIRSNYTCMYHVPGQAGCKRCGTWRPALCPASHHHALKWALSAFWRCQLALGPSIVARRAWVDWCSACFRRVGGEASPRSRSVHLPRLSVHWDAWPGWESLGDGGMGSRRGIITHALPCASCSCVCVGHHRVEQGQAQRRPSQPGF
jgi:hypothetical protein